MEVVIARDEVIGELVADEIATLVTRTPTSVLGLATGSSPLLIYRSLIERHRRGELSFAQARAFTLDEYVGLPDGHPCSYRHVIDDEFVSHVDFAPGAVCAPDGTAADPAAAGAAYDRALVASGGVDLQILGIGVDGHIAFNEPGSSFASRTRVKTLTDQTRRDNARFFGGDVDAVPRHCLTQGLGTIMEARRISLVAVGADKAEAVAQLVEGSVSARWPATILQHHPQVTVLVDDAAASRLQLVDYYRDVRTHKHLVS